MAVVGFPSSVRLHCQWRNTFADPGSHGLGLREILGVTQSQILNRVVRDSRVNSTALHQLAMLPDYTLLRATFLHSRSLRFAGGDFSCCCSLFEVCFLATTSQGLLIPMNRPKQQQTINKNKNKNKIKKQKKNFYDSFSCLVIWLLS